MHMGPRVAIAAFLLFLAACAPAPEAAPQLLADTGPTTVTQPTEPVTEPEESAGTAYVRGLARAVLVEPELAGKSGEPLVRALYRYLIEQVYFADPVGLDAWRYEGGDGEPIPYLENRALSPLRFHIGSCEDFAAALAVLLQEAGFAAEYVAGYTLSVDQIYIDHAWAVVNLDGIWYHLDPQLEQNVTRGGALAWRYYLRSDSDLIVDHKWGENLIDHWPHIPSEEQEAIREQYTPPACPESYPRPDEEMVELPHRPDGAVVERELERMIRESGRGELPWLPLNVEPPVLVAEHHITPPLQRQPESARGYGRSFLTGERARLYDELLALARRYPQGEPVHPPAVLNNDDIAAVADAVLYDRAELYWASFSVAESGGERRVELELEGNSQRAASRLEQVEAAADRILKPLLGRSDFEQAVGIHDALAATVRYDREELHGESGNIYGALVEKIAYCDGYARAFQYLADRAGLETAYLKGTSRRGVPHAWNAVRLAGTWHYIDVTWDRPLREEDGVYHDYCLMTEEELLREHVPDRDQYPALPPADSGEHRDWYGSTGRVLAGEPDVDALARALLAGLRERAEYPVVADPVYLEIKAAGSPEEYTRWKDYLVKEVFSVLRRMEDTARREGLPFAVVADASVQCDFNDAMQVMTVYPKVQMRMEGV